MIHKAALAAGVLSAISAPALAQGFSGGTLGVEVNAPTDFDDFGGTTYFLGGEYAVTRQFSIGADASSYRFDNIGQDASSATLHGIYHLSSTASAGLFVGVDRFDGDDANLLGLEFGTEFQSGYVEVYAGRMDDGAETGNLFGATGAYALQNGFALTGDAARANYDDGDVSKFALGAGYTLQAGPELYAEIGKVSQTDDGVKNDDTYIGLGARINFGAARGTTFDQRSLFEILPQF